MKINELQPKPEIDVNIKSKEAYLQFEKLLIALRKKDLPNSVVVYINKDIEELNSFILIGAELSKIVKKKQARIMQQLEKEHNIVSQYYYRNMWLAVGMAAFGIPLGVAIGASLGNMAFLSFGLPIGLGIGVAVGTAKDKKAFREGRQLDLKIKN